MKRAAALALLVAVAVPLAAQRGGAGGAGGRITRTPGASGFPSGRFLDPEIDQPIRAAHSGPIPFPATTRQWLRVDTPHFIILSALGERTSRLIAVELERLTASLAGTSPFFRVPEKRTRVFLFEHRTNAQPYFDAVGGARVDASGITLRHPLGSTMLIDAGARGGGVSTSRHELVHDLLRRNERALPLWIEEGLAEYYSNAGQPIREHASRVRGRLGIRLDELFVMNVNTPRAWTYDFYAESWAAVATLMRRDARAFFAFLEDLDRGVDTVTALRVHYRISPRDLEGSMRNAGAPVPLMQLSEVSTSMTMMPMHRADLLYELGEMLSRIRGRDEDAQRHLRASVDARATLEAAVRP
jgi:hypothetical protein